MVFCHSNLSRFKQKPVQTVFLFLFYPIYNITGRYKQCKTKQNKSPNKTLTEELHHGRYIENCKKGTWGKFAWVEIRNNQHKMNKAIVKIAQNFLIEIYDGKIKYL